MTDILDLKVKINSNHKTSINYDFFDPKNPRKHTLCSIVVQTTEKVISNMANGGHFGFWPLMENVHMFVSHEAQI